MACRWIAEADHGLDRWAFAAQQAQGAGDEEALAVLRDRVEQQQPGEDATLGGGREAAMRRDHRARRGDGEDGDAGQHRPRPRGEQPDRDLGGGIGRQIVMLGNERAGGGIIDDIDRIGVGVDHFEIVDEAASPLAPALAAGRFHGRGPVRAEHGEGR